MSKQYKRLILLLSVLFLGIAFLVKTEMIVGFDQSIYHFIMQFQSERFTFFFRQMTHMGEAPVLIALFLILLILKYQLGIRCILFTAGNSILNQILKQIFVRSRPEIMQLIVIDGYSFPSGHSMAAMCVYGYLIYTVYHSSIQKDVKILLCILLSMIIVLVGISRIYLGVHYASDVLGGFLISIIYLLIVVHYDKNRSKAH